jgi:hypothetical protein
MADWPDEAKTAIEALQDEIEIRDDAHCQCLADLEWCADMLARVIRDGIPEWSRPTCNSILRRIQRNI